MPIEEKLNTPAVVERSNDVMDDDQVEYALADWCLSLLVASANRGVGLGVTLFVNGAVITGDLISSEAYFNQFADQYESVFAQTDVAEESRKIADVYRVMAENAADEWKDGNSVPIGYLHLANARIFTPGRPPEPDNGILWRGRITTVSGFSLGKIERGTSL